MGLFLWLAAANSSHGQRTRHTGLACDAQEMEVQKRGNSSSGRVPGENDMAGLAGTGRLDELLFDRWDQRFGAVPKARVDFECLMSPLLG